MLYCNISRRKNMGAVDSSINPNLVKFLTTQLSLSVFIETKTFRGNTIALIKPYFSQIFSIESSEKYYQAAVSRFKNDHSVTILKGDSSIVLTDLVKQMNHTPTLFWLDVYWSEDEQTVGKSFQCLLLDELGALAHLHEKSVILIDDARFLLCPPGQPHDYAQWPDFNAILAALNKLSTTHQVMVLNDVILYYPQQIKDALSDFAHNQGTDWLEVMVKSRDYDILLKEVTAKEKVIVNLYSTVKEQVEAIQKLSLFRYTSFLYWLYRLLPPPLRSKLKEIFAQYFPPVGQLHYYSPIPLQLPQQYYQPVHLAATPTISIVTPSFNQAHFLEQTIQSVLDQAYPSLEYIVQDGGSTDDTHLILEQYHSQLTHVESRQDNGQAQAINFGFVHATGQIMAWLNSDDLLLPGTLNYVVDFFNQHPEVDVVYGQRVLIDENGQEVGRWILPPHSDHALRWIDLVPQETLFWRRRIWEKVGGQIDESYQFALDWELLLRFQAAGAKIVRLPRFLGAFRVHPAQKTSRELTQLGEVEMTRLREQYHKQFVSQKEVSQNIRPYLTKSRIYHALYRLGVLRY